MEKALIKLIIDRRMAHLSIISGEGDSTKNKDLREQERLLEEARWQKEKREVARARGMSTSGEATQPPSSTDQPRGYSKIAEKRMRRKELTTKARADRTMKEDDHQGKREDIKALGGDKRSREDDKVLLI